MKSKKRSDLLGRGGAKAKIHEALLNGALTIEEVRRLGISKATAYRVLAQMMKSGEVSLWEGVENGNVRVAYVLKSGTLPATSDLLNVALERMKSKNAAVRQEALKDLRELSKTSRIIDNATLNYLITLAETELNLPVLEILTYQAIHARKDENPRVLKALQPLTPKASTVAADTTRPVEVREKALLFMQVTAPFDDLSNLAIKIIADPSDPALSIANPTQMGIIVQSICVKAARLGKFRSKIYDLLLSDNPAIVTRAQQILNQSREPLSP